MSNKILFVCNAVKWFDKVNGNTYHSVRVIRCEDGKTIVGQFEYGYGNQYQYTALKEMLHAGWIDQKYKEHPYNFERENDYPIHWVVTDGLKRECVANGVL